jgi:hypothetical protein
VCDIANCGNTGNSCVLERHIASDSALLPNVVDIWNCPGRYREMKGAVSTRYISLKNSDD